MHSSISSSEHRGLGALLPILGSAAAVFVIYGAIVQFWAPDFDLGITQDATNRIAAERYVDEDSSPNMVIVGSSLSYRMPSDVLGPGFFNLSLSGKDSLTGIEIVERARPNPHLLLVETNLLAWPVPAMIIVVVGLLAMRKVSRWDGLFLGLFAAQVVAYAAYWYDGEFLGPRFLYTALPAIVVLTVRAPFVLAARLGERSRRGIVAFMGACLLIAWCAPRVDFNVWGLARQARGARGTLKVDPGAVVHDAGIHHALIFMREPFTNRLTRRLWGLGFTRSETAQLVASRDACSLFLAVRAAERVSVASAPTTLGALVNASDSIMQRRRETTHDGQLADSIAIPCQMELVDDKRLGGAAFGPALPLEPIGDGGRIAGDIVYVTDLSDRNEVLKPRFADRAWYRFVVGRTASGEIRGVLRPY